MSTKSLCIALTALALTAGFGTVAEAQRSAVHQAAAITQAACTTSYGTEADADGHLVSVTSLTCSRPAARVASGMAL